VKEAAKKDQFRRWAFDIASNPRAYPSISIEKAVGAMNAWKAELPTALRDRARELRMYDLIGETAPESPE